MVDWRTQVKEGDFVAVAVPDGGNGGYGYARVERSAIPTDTSILVTLYTQVLPRGKRGTVPAPLLVVPMTPDQFSVARQSGWPSSYDRGRAICNQTTQNIGKA